MQTCATIFWVVLLLVAGCQADAQSTDPSLSEISDFLASHDYVAALSRTDVLLKNRSDDARLWIAHGLALRGLQRNSESVESFRRALQFAPGNLIALKGAAEATYSLHDPATHIFVEAILATNPSDSVANAMSASLAYEAGDCAKAVPLFEKAHEVLNSNMVASLQLSHCLVLRGEAADAVKLLRALAQKERDDLVTFDLAAALFYAGSYEDSLEILEQLRSQKVETGQMWNLLGADYDKLERVPAALDAYRRACEKAPDVAGYYIDLARFAMEHSSADAALKVLDAGIARLPKSAALLTVRGSIRSFQGDAAGADVDFASAEAADPGSGFGRIGEGLQLSDSGQSAKAEQVLRSAVEKDPRDPEVKYLLAELLLKISTPATNEEAGQLLEEVLRDRPNDPNVLLALSRTLLAKHENKSALALLLRAKSADAGSAPILNRLLQTYRALGMRQESAATATELRAVVDRDREAELRRNRFQITANSQEQDLRNKND